jgi:hypothetical protein
MRHLRHTVLAALVVAVCAAPAAAAHPHGDSARPVIAPARGGGLTGGELLGEAWARSLTGSNQPFHGTCTTVARNVLGAHGGPDGTATCTATRHSRLFVFFGTFCANFEDPSLITEQQQLACAVAGDQNFEALNITVDGETTNIVRPRFELFSPQRTIELPADYGFDGPATFTAHAYGAIVRSLRPGHHTVTVEVVNPDFGPPFEFITISLDIVRGGHSDDQNE